MLKANQNAGNMLIVLLSLTYIALLDVSIFDIYVNYSLYINLAITALCLLFINRISRNYIIYISILLIFLSLSVLISDGGFGSIVTFITPMILFFCISQASFGVRSMKIIIMLCAIAIVCIFAYSIPYGENYTVYSKTQINPNTFGMYLLYSFSIWICFVDTSKLKNRLFSAGLLILVVLGMYNLESRGTTVALLCFIIIVLIPNKVLTQKLFFVLTILVITVGTIFPFIYLNLYRNGVDFEVFEKTIYTGREYIWMNMVQKFSDTPISILFGLGSKVELWDYSLNVHNNYFNIIVNFGVTGYVLYFAFVLYYIHKSLKRFSNPLVKKCLLMFLCTVLILGFTETTSLWSVTFIFAYLGLGIGYGEYLKFSRETPLCEQK